MPKVFEPTTIGPIAVRNRLVRSATWEAMADADGCATERLVALYRELAAGGVGLIISSYLYVRADGRQHADQLGACEEAQVAGLARIADAVHGAGGAIVGQIVHCGGQTTRAVLGGATPVAPSAVASPGYPEVPRALTGDEIGPLAQAFAAAAARLQRAGFDGVQLHGAHGYLLAQFLSPLRNRRTDRYGGDLAGRSRFALEVYDGVREAVGARWPVMIKLNAHDFLAGSTTEADSTHLAAALAARGIDAIEVSGGTPGSGTLGPARVGVGSAAEEAYFLPQARAIRAAAPAVPLMLVGGVRSLETIERILAAGEADYFSLCRPLIREPDLPRRWQAGDRRPADCVSCSGCFGPARRGEGIRCVKRAEA